MATVRGAAAPPPYGTTRSGVPERDDGVLLRPKRAPGASAPAVFLGRRASTCCTCSAYDLRGGDAHGRDARTRVVQALANLKAFKSIMEADAANFQSWQSIFGREGGDAGQGRSTFACPPAALPEMQWDGGNLSICRSPHTAVQRGRPPRRAPPRCDHIMVLGSSTVFLKELSLGAGLQGGGGGGEEGCG